MFMEISNLVTQQGELVDNIEHVGFSRPHLFWLWG